MIFENTKVGFRFIDVIRCVEKKRYIKNNPRSFCALSYRLNSHTVIRQNGVETVHQTGDITYVPANISYERFADYEDFLCIHFEVFNDDSTEICKYVPKNPDKIKELFFEAFKLAASTSAERIYKGSAILNEIFALIIAEISCDKKYPANFIAVKTFIDNNYSNPQLTIKTVSETIGISEVHMRRLFHNEMNMSPKKYLNSVRIRAARSMINTGNYSVAEIAENVGFYDEKYFSQVFKKYTSSSPTKYRENDRTVKEIFGKFDKKTKAE